MHPKARVLLHDVQQSGILLERFLNGKIFDDYVADPLLRSAVERQLEVIGEALNQLSKIDPANVARVRDYRRIVALRNILIHGYARVDNRVIWNILEQSVPVLRQEVDALLREP